MENNEININSSKKEQFLKKVLAILLIIWMVSTLSLYFLYKPFKLEPLNQEKVSNSLNTDDVSPDLNSINVPEGDQVKSLEKPSGVSQP